MPLCLYPFSPEVLEKAKTQQGHFTFVLVKIDFLGFICPNLFLPVCSLSHWRRLHQPVSCASLGLTFKSLFFHPHQSQSVNHQVLSILPTKDLPFHPAFFLSIHSSIHPSFHACIHPFIHPPIHPSIHLSFHFFPAHSCGPHPGCQHFSPGWLQQPLHCPRVSTDCPQLTASLPLPVTARVVLLQCWLDHDTSLPTSPSSASHGPEKSHLLSMIQLGFWDLPPASFSVTTCAESYLFSAFTLAIPSTWVLSPLSMAPLPQFSGVKGQVLPEASPDPPYSGLPQLAPIVTTGILWSNVRIGTTKGVKRVLGHIMMTTGVHWDWPRQT